jgi:Protein of unknown function (DUF2589)
MADFVPLQALVHAIASAVTEAQQEVEKAHVANLVTYLDREHRPLTLQLRVPSIRPEASPGEEDTYQAPLLALVPQSMLRIKQVEISFDIELGDLAGPASQSKAPSGAPVAPQAADIIAAQVKRDLNVNPAVSATVKQQGTSAHVVVTIESIDQPDGVSRLVMDLTKTQGITGPADKQTKS